ncbi:MFS transporter [Sphingomonas sp. ZT3P38]|uniref:MFS transporter n=1 Tax=Parasphingomonas zepuensis TaxID=3096161 RepID=UPI002FC91DC6
MALGPVPATPTPLLHEIPPDTGGRPAVAERAWPSSRSAYFALSIIILATFLNFFDSTVFGMLAQRIKIDFGLTDEQLGFLGGPANIIFYVFVGIPLARLADIYPRKYVLAGGIAVIGGITALGGLAQTFWQFVSTRMFVGAGSSAHAPASYSLLADAFPPKKITRAFALLQLGFIGGTTLGVFLGGQLIGMVSSWPDSHWLGLTIHNWQWLLIWVGVPGFFVSLLFLLVKEPPRAPPSTDAGEVPEQAGLGRRMLTFTGLDAAKAIHARGRVYYPLFAGLALSATETFGLQFWRTPFMIRTYGWDEARIGTVMAPMLLVASLLGVFLGGFFVEWLAKRYKDANVRAATILFGMVTICSIISPLMPTGESSLAVMSLGAMFGLAGAVPQNAAIQRVAPNAMRGQVTAIYLFMFTFFGAMGSFVVGSVAQRVIGVEADLWKALVLTASVLLPMATFFMYLGIRPYREEVERLEAQAALR